MFSPILSCTYYAMCILKQERNRNYNRLLGIWKRSTVVLPLCTGDPFQDPGKMPEAKDNTKPYICYVFSPYIHTDDKV